MAKFISDLIEGDKVFINTKGKFEQAIVTGAKKDASGNLFKAKAALNGAVHFINLDLRVTPPSDTVTDPIDGEVWSTVEPTTEK
jgi:hypothetical protein